MANVDIDIGGKTMNVDIDGLENMSPEAQQATIQQVSQQGMSGGPAVPSALPTAPDTSYSGALGYGLHGAAEGLGATMKLAGQETGWNGLTNAGTAVQGSMGAPKNYQPADIGADLKAGNYGQAFSDLPRAAVQAAPDMAATVGAGAVGSLAGPAGTAAGIGAYTTARNAGDNVAARQAANNEPAGSLPSTGDLVGGALTTGAQVAGNVVGLGKVPGISGALEALPVVARLPAAAALDGTAAAGSNLATQVGDTAGTTKGLTVDPYEAVGAGLQGAAARAATLAPGAAKAGVKAASDAGMAALAEPPASLADAASISRVNSMLDTATTNAKATKGDTSPMAVANSVKSEVVTSLQSLASQLQDVDLITKPQYRNLRTVIDNQAQRNNNTITESGGNGPPSLFDQINQLDLPEAAIQTLQDGARDLNTLSTQSFQKNAKGPFQAIGGLVGQGAALAGAASTMNPIAIAGAVMGHGIEGKIGSALGSGVDRLMGTNTPAVQLRGRAADAMLMKAGLPTGGNSLQSLADLRDSIQDPSATTGLPSSEIPVNTPIKASGSPLQGPPASVPTLVPNTAADVSAAYASDPTQMAPPATTPEAAGLPPPKAPWMNYVSQDHTPEQIHQAVDDATAAGHYTPAQAAALHTHTGPVQGSFLTPIQNQLGVTPTVRQAPPLISPGASGAALPPPPGYRGPIFDPTKYQAQIDQYQSHAAAKIGLAAGDPGLQAVIGNIRDEPSMAKKQALASAFLATLSGPRLAAAQQLLSGPLMQSKVA